VPAGSFNRCIRIVVTSLTETNIPPRELTFAPGVGLVQVGNDLPLVAAINPDTVDGLPVLAIQDSVLLSWPLSNRSFEVETSDDLETWESLQRPASTVSGRNELAVPRNQVHRHFRLAAPR
jgi:hypothetical protein